LCGGMDLIHAETIPHGSRHALNILAIQVHYFRTGQPIAATRGLSAS
jgi:hypothetical protein